MNLTPTQRGFLRGEFLDRYDSKCSIQKSSLATEDCIWLGRDDVRPQYCVLNEGWKDYPLPLGVETLARMHLTREQVAELIPLLQHFVDTGDLPGNRGALEGSAGSRSSTPLRAGVAVDERRAVEVYAAGL